MAKGGLTRNFLKVVRRSPTHCMGGMGTQVFIERKVSNNSNITDVKWLFASIDAGITMKKEWHPDTQYERVHFRMDRVLKNYTVAKKRTGK